MLTIVVYHQETKKIIMMLPLCFDNDVKVTKLDTLLHKEYSYRVFCKMDPVIYEDDDGDLCLKDNSFLINSNELK